jgi:hypothetical protein
MAATTATWCEVRTIEQILYRAPRGSADTILRTATSVKDLRLDRHWQETLEPWLRAGGPLGRCFVDFGAQAAAIRWYSGTDRRYDWQYAKALLGDPAILTGIYLLELPELEQPAVFPDGKLLQVTRIDDLSRREEIARRARSADASALLVTLLGTILEGRRQTIIAPWPGPGQSEAAMWGLLNLLSMLGDTEPISYLSYSAGRPPNISGRFISFRPGADLVRPDEGYEKMARDLVNSFSRDPERLRQMLRNSGLLESTSHASRVARLIKQLPRIMAGDVPTFTVMQPPRTSPAAPTKPPAAAPAPAAPAAPAASSAAPAASAGSGPGPVVQCPLCLGDIRDWDQLKYWRWVPDPGEYVEVQLEPGLSDAQRKRLLRGAQVRCPNSSRSAHYLPVNYGRYGEPVHLGFVGVSKSGKSHLLAAMVHAVEEGELEQYGITCSPLDHSRHRRFVKEWVNPLFDHNKKLRGTPESLDTFVDAFLVSHNGGPQRPVVLFDVAGGLLSGLDDAAPENTPEFLSIASGLFFVIAPEHVTGRRSADEAFSNVIGTLQETDRTAETSVAIILNKADMLRFEPRVARWLRAETDPLDPVELLRESADVYSFLQHRRATLTMPYKACARATLHVASPTGGSDDGREDGIYPRGVTPRRVVNPLVAMLAMTGVLSGPEAQGVGI